MRRCAGLASALISTRDRSRSHTWRVSFKVSSKDQPGASVAMFCLAFALLTKEMPIFICTGLRAGPAPCLKFSSAPTGWPLSTCSRVPGISWSFFQVVKALNAWSNTA